MKRLKRKLRAGKGEALVETLAALLVAVIALAILVGMIMSSSKLIRDSRTRFDSYYAADARLNSMVSTDGTNATVQVIGEDGITLRLTDAQAANTIPVMLFENGKASAYRIK